MNQIKIFFAKKTIDYYRKMGEDSILQTKYQKQKIEVENLLDSLK